MLRTALPRASARSLSVLLLAAALAFGLVSPAVAAPPSVGTFPSGIDDYARYEGQGECLNVEQPGVREFRDLVLRAYPNTGRGNIVRGCDVGGRSEHKEGRAWDWSVNVGNAAEKAAADELLAWLLATDEHGNAHAMARRFGIMYIIWDRQVWSAYRPDLGWQPYRGASPHTDHVHVSFSWAGARRQTSFFTGRPYRPGAFPDIMRGSTLEEPVTWLSASGITQGDRDGNFGPTAAVTRGQMASFLWRMMGEPHGARSADFPDVARGSQHHAAISWLAEAGITVGDADGRFRPDAEVTRGQMGLFLWRTVGEPGGSPHHGFSDVAAVHSRAVSWLNANAITQGATADRYDGGVAVTRGQMALFLFRLSGSPDAWAGADPVSPAVRF